MLDRILQTLMFKKKIKTAQLARELEMPKQTLNRIVNGTSPNPHSKNLLPLADYFNISLEQLQGKKPLPNNLVDLHLPSEKPKAKMISLFGWQDLLNMEQKQEIDSDTTIFVTHGLSDMAFAVPLDDTSMEPMFRKDSILIMDPDKQYGDRSFVLVKLYEANQVIFRQLLIDADQRYLKSISPDLDTFPMRLLDDNDQIIGTLVEARQVF